MNLIRCTIILTALSLLPACSLLVSFDDPEQTVQKCDMMPPDCSVEACMERPECAPVPCTAEVIYYDSPPACGEVEKCIWSDTEGAFCVGDYFFTEGNFYDRCDQKRCPHGAVCIEGMVGSPSVCIPYCNQFSHARCPEEGRCYAMDESAIIDICFKPDDCNPIKNTGCPAGEGCYFIPPNDVTCLPAGEKPAGDRCKILWDCMGGHVCSQPVPGDFGTCLKVCSGPEECGPDESCEPIGVYGVCVSATEPL
mgnify:CR=1 FL=1